METHVSYVFTFDYTLPKRRQCQSLLTEKKKHLIISFFSFFCICQSFFFSFYYNSIIYFLSFSVEIYVQHVAEESADRSFNAKAKPIGREMCINNVIMRLGELLNYAEKKKRNVWVDEFIRDIK